MDEQRCRSRTLGNMRQNGVRSLAVSRVCCRHEAVVECGPLARPRSRCRAPQPHLATKIGTSSATTAPDHTGCRAPLDVLGSRGFVKAGRRSA